MKKRIVYISGKVSGLPESEYIENFHKAEMTLREEGCIVVNPTTDDRIQMLVRTGASYREIIKKCIDVLDECNAINMMGCCVKSKGARLEEHYARAVGMDRRYEELDRSAGRPRWFGPESENVEGL